MKKIALMVLAVLLCSPARADMAHQFVLVGFIESFTVDAPVAGQDEELVGGKIKVHGVEVIMPKNLIIQMPARYLTPHDIVALNPLSPGINSGLALNDIPPPLASYEATVVGNIVGDKYIAGLIWIAQHSLAEGAGYIKDIAPNGEIHLVADPNSGAAAQPITRIRINDPDGVYAPPDPLADKRFKVDKDNPTIHAGTGYPMCIAHVGAPGECPDANRPDGPDGKPLTTFVMGANGLPGSPLGALPIPPCPACDQTRQAPLKRGDYIIYAGTLAKDGAGTYISAHTVGANVGIYTAQGVDPAYVFIEGSLIGTQGPLIPRDPADPTVTFPQETQDRLKIEGVTTDPSRDVELYAIDVDPDGNSILRIFNTVPVQPAPLGRFRHILGARANALFDSAGNLKGATRELMARVVASAESDNLDGDPLPTGPVVAHGLVAGQYVAPFGEFIFTENKVIGDPILPNNFDCLPFLLLGSGKLTTIVDSDGLNVGPPPNVRSLDPWPDIIPAPAAVNCGPPPKPLL
jgi:hypothetical protein